MSKLFGRTEKGMHHEILWCIYRGEEDGDFMRAELIASFSNPEDARRFVFYTDKLAAAQQRVKELEAALEDANYEMAAVTATPDAPDFTDALSRGNPADNICLVNALNAIRRVRKDAQKEAGE